MFIRVDIYFLLQVCQNQTLFFFQILSFSLNICKNIEMFKDVSSLFESGNSTFHIKDVFYWKINLNFF